MILVSKRETEREREREGERERGEKERELVNLSTINSTIYNIITKPLKKINML